jgi:hypothetical protein
MAFLSTPTTGMDTLTNIVSSMQVLFTFFIGLFSDLFTTITGTPILWVPLALSILFMIVWKVPKMVKKLRRV